MNDDDKGSSAQSGMDVSRSNGGNSYKADKTPQQMKQPQQHASEQPNTGTFNHSSPDINTESSIPNGLLNELLQRLGDLPPINNTQQNTPYSTANPSFDLATEILASLQHAINSPRDQTQDDKNYFQMQQHDNSNNNNNTSFSTPQEPILLGNSETTILSALLQQHIGSIGGPLALLLQQLMNNQEVSPATQNQKKAQTPLQDNGQNGETTTLPPSEETCVEISNDMITEIQNNEELRTVPCMARRAPPDHNIKTGYFVIPSTITHGTALLCSHKECRKEGTKFCYCVVCGVPVARRNFKKRHEHSEITFPRGNGYYRYDNFSTQNKSVENRLDAGDSSVSGASLDEGPQYLYQHQSSDRKPPPPTPTPAIFKKIDSRNLKNFNDNFAMEMERSPSSPSTKYMTPNNISDNLRFESSNNPSSNTKRFENSMIMEPSSPMPPKLSAVKSPPIVQHNHNKEHTTQGRSSHQGGLGGEVPASAFLDEDDDPLRQEELRQHAWLSLLDERPLSDSDENMPSWLRQVLTVSDLKYPFGPRNQLVPPTSTRKRTLTPNNNKSITSQTSSEDANTKRKTDDSLTSSDYNDDMFGSISPSSGSGYDTLSVSTFKPGRKSTSIDTNYTKREQSNTKGKKTSKEAPPQNAKAQRGKSQSSIGEGNNKNQKESKLSDQCFDTTGHSANAQSHTHRDAKKRRKYF